MSKFNEVLKSEMIARAIADGSIHSKQCPVKAYNPDEFVYDVPFRRLGSSWQGHALAAGRAR